MNFRTSVRNAAQNSWLRGLSAAPVDTFQAPGLRGPQSWLWTLLSEAAHPQSDRQRFREAKHTPVELVRAEISSVSYELLPPEVRQSHRHWSSNEQ